MELVELSAQDNRVAAIPAALSSCTNLQCLRLENNRCVLRREALCGPPQRPAARRARPDACAVRRHQPPRVAAIPPGLLHGMSSLWLLQLGGNPLTIEQLRESDGYASLDARRRARATKQVRASSHSWNAHVRAPNLRDAPEPLGARIRTQSQIEGRVLLDGTSAFEEGADAQQFNHWNV